jgi:hypothetical protein
MAWSGVIFAATVRRALLRLSQIVSASLRGGAALSRICWRHNEPKRHRAM